MPIFVSESKRAEREAAAKAEKNRNSREFVRALLRAGGAAGASPNIASMIDSVVDATDFVGIAS